jgi:hypothetical protein
MLKQRNGEFDGSIKDMLSLRTILLCLTVLGIAYSSEADTDGDGLSDRFEQALLLRFAPRLHISASDCDIAPSEFEPGSPVPNVKARNGTIYGQVFPAKPDGAAAGLIEIHFYHLWGSDCGLTPHPLDAESVSGLLRADRNRLLPEAWQAVFWYAAAHESTLCDMSNAATAAAVEAVEHGPDVWVSRGKHASFLSRDLCSQGCGGDLCDSDQKLQISRVINLGEPGAPMNGSDWSSSASWPLASKMTPRYTGALIERMPTGREVAVVPARDFARGTRTTVNVAARTYGSMASANRSTNAGLTMGARGTATGLELAGDSTTRSATHAERSLASATTATLNSLRRTFRWINVRTTPHHAKTVGR